jgi:hypothetical protein
MTDATPNPVPLGWDAIPQRYDASSREWLEAENRKLWDRAAQADYETARAGLRAAQLHLVLGSVLRTFAKPRHTRTDVYRTSQVEAATLHRWQQVFEANRPSARHAVARDADRHRELREQLVAAGTEAADLWLASRANRRMSDVNRRRLAGHVVGMLWENIERAAIGIAESIAEDDRAEAGRLRAELAEQRDRRGLCPATFEGAFKVHYCQRERSHSGRHHALMGNDWAAMRDNRACGLLWGDHPADTEVVDGSQLPDCNAAAPDDGSAAKADFHRTLQRLRETDPVGAAVVDHIVAGRKGEPE